MKKLLVDGFTTQIACPTGSFRVLVYRSGVDVSTSTLRYLSACLRTRRRPADTQRPDALYADRGDAEKDFSGASILRYRL